MNNQELIKKYEEILINGKSDFKSAHIYQTFLKELRQLDEPQKVTVPQFVADWVNKAKGWGKTLYYALDHSPEEVNLWFCEDEANHQNNFARAWLDGYEVEKEKRYEVKLKNTDDYLVKTNNDDYRFYNNIYTTRRKHTREEIEKAGFGWVFDCPGVKVKEVE